MWTPRWLPCAAVEVEIADFESKTTFQGYPQDVKGVTSMTLVSLAL